MAHLKAVSLLAVLVGVAYGGSLANELVFDDLIFSTRDVRVQSLTEAPKLFLEPLWAFTDRPGEQGVHQYYRPFQLLPLAVLHALFADPAAAAHLLNLLFHFTNCVLVWLLSRRLLDSNELALFVSTVFAVHPGHSEAVLWVSDIAGLGSATCLLSIILLHTNGSTRRLEGAVSTALLFFVGLLFKESALLVPFVLLAYDTVRPGAVDNHNSRGRILPYVALVPPLAAYMWLRVHALGGLLPGFKDNTLGLSALIANGIGLLPSYASTFFWPTNLNMYHDFNPVTGLGDPMFLAGLAVLIGIVGGFAYSARSHPMVAFSMLWALAMAAPYLIIRWPRLNVFAERYLYLSSVGLLWLIAYTSALGLARYGPRLRHIMILPVAGFLVVFLFIDVARTREWRDETTLYTKTLEQSERAELIRNNLALRYLHEERYDEGIRLLEDLTKLDPGFSDAHHNLGLLYQASGSNQAALASFERANELNPRKRETLLNLGYVYDSLGRREEAINTYFRLVLLDPAHRDGWYNLAIVAYESNQPANARAAAGQVLSLDSNDGAARELLRRIDAGALAAVRPPRRETLQRCRRAKAAVQAGHYRSALVTLKTAAWIDEAAPLPHHYIANVYYLMGHLDQAAMHERLALQRAPESELYRSNLESLEKELALQAGIH